ncbi:MAG: LamG domain-containing protein [Promethearchaeota archaeon]
MKTNYHKKTKCLISVILLTIIILSSFSSVIPLISNKADSNLETELLNPMDDNLETSDTYQVGSEYDLDEWWNTTFRYRIGIEIEELNGLDRYQPVEMYLEFEESEFYEGTGRLVAYYGPGSWSDPLPVQVWNVKKYYGTDFIHNCSITFMATVSANTNQTYFFYYNENDDDINTNYDYGTDFLSILTGGTTLTVNVRGDSGSDYKLVLEEGSAVKTLEKDGIALNYHHAESLAPEKQLTVSSLKFLTHMDENTGNRVYDSTGNIATWGLVDGATWTSGIVKYGLYFDGINDYIDFGAELESVGDPFHGATTQWTMTCWIKPDDITSDTSATNHGTTNCFMAKASDPYNDNFEIGVNADGTIHLYLDLDGRDSYFDFQYTGTINVGEWNFVALKLDLTKANYKVGVRVNDDPFEYTTNWDAGTDMDEAYSSQFTIGSSEHIDNYFEGDIDEVAFYDEPLSDADIETYKYLSNPSVIDEITELVDGDIFSRYQIDWTETFDMHVSDICTFYWDYNLWSINRSVYFDGTYDANESAMIPLNTHYDFSLIDDHDQLRYIYDGKIDVDITDPDFVSKDYTIVYNYPDAAKDAIGIFIENYSLSNPGAMSLTYFNGTTNYYDNIIDYTPGNINDLDNSGGGSINTLYVQYWEFVDSVPYTNNNELKWYFNNISASLKNPINIYIYEEDSRFYNIKVYVEDHDGRAVPEATVTIWNNTVSATSYKWIQDTDETGWTTFQRFENGTYVLNASYVRFGQTLSITSSQTILDLAGEVNPQGVKTVQFLDVSLTSIVLNCTRLDNLLVPQGPLSGAKLNFTYDDGTGSGPVVLNGFESTNSSGAAVFRWKNATASGNVTFSIQWFDYWQNDISTPLDKLGTDPTKICLDFTDYAWYEIDVVQGREFESHLDIYDAGLDSKQLGDILSVWVNFSFTENGTNPKPMTGITVNVKLDLKIGTTLINQNPLIFVPGTGAGNYSLYLDTSQLIEPGGAAWMSSITYTVIITASKPGYDTVINTTEITLLDITSRVSANESQSSANWNEMLIFYIHYEYYSAGMWDNINNAEVTFYAIQAPEVAGTLIWTGSGGLYRFEINSTAFPGTGNYDLMITATKQNYETKAYRHPVTILEIRTLLNGTIDVSISEKVYFGEAKIFYFNYTEATSGRGLSSAEIASFKWEKQDDLGNRIGGGYNVPLINTYEGIYMLDFDTETLDIATYIFKISIKKDNYEEAEATIYLFVVTRDFATTAKRIYKVVSGKTLTITLTITDNKTHDLLDIDRAYVTFRGLEFNFTGSSGIYEAKITNIPDAFIMPETIAATITIIRENYTTLEIQIAVEVQMVEIWPGMPMFYFLLIAVAVAAVAGSLVTYRYIQQRRIPKFVKKAREMRSDIKGKKSISDSLLYPTKDQYMVKKLGDKWEMLGLSLEDILGIESKKRKNLSEMKEEFEGGGI